MGRHKKVTDENARKVAVLAALGHTQSQIREQLGVEDFSAPTIARLMEKARKDGLIVQKTECSLTPAEQDAVIQEISGAQGLHQGLAKIDALGRLKRVRIYSSASDADVNALEPRSWERTLRAFARRAAPDLAELFTRDVRHLGVAWGKTLSFVVSEIAAHLAKERPSESRVLIFPICGDPMDVWGAPEQSTAVLVGRLGLALNGTDESENVFMGIPGTIPREFKGDAEDVIRRFFASNDRYDRVMRPRGLLDLADTIFTSASAVDASVGPWMEEAARAAGLTVQELSRTSLGNIAGVVLERPDLRKNDKTRIEEINRRSTGVDEKRLAACAARAMSDFRTPGVVVVSCGPKAEIILEAVRRGLINHLFIDHVLAEDLGRRLASAS